MYSVRVYKSAATNTAVSIPRLVQYNAKMFLVNIRWYVTVYNGTVGNQTSNLGVFDPAGSSSANVVNICNYNRI
jgi:hypothetical protein